MSRGALSAVSWSLPVPVTFSERASTWTKNSTRYCSTRRAAANYKRQWDLDYDPPGKQARSYCDGTEWRSRDLLGLRHSSNLELYERQHHGVRLDVGLTKERLPCAISQQRTSKVVWDRSFADV